MALNRRAAQIPVFCAKNAQKQLFALTRDENLFVFLGLAQISQNATPPLCLGGVFAEPKPPELPAVPRKIIRARAIKNRRFLPPALNQGEGAARLRAAPARARRGRLSVKTLMCRHTALHWGLGLQVSYALYSMPQAVKSTRVIMS